MQASKNATPVPVRLGPYVLGKRLGGGGMGDVYQATHDLMKARPVAIKLLKPHMSGHAQFVQRFLREIEALGGVRSHPNLIRAEYADFAGDLPYLVMEYVEGLDLEQILKQTGPLALADACNVMHQAAQGLAAVHEAGVVHRDLKPSNLMLTQDGTVKILDLGLARLALTEETREELTSTHCLLGTMDYMAPEQADDPRDVDIRADIYSLGCTLYKLLTGRPPYFEFMTSAQKIRAHADVPFPPWPASVPPELRTFAQRMVAKHRDQRPATPDEVVTALRPWCAGSTLKPVSTAGALARPADPSHVTPGGSGAETIDQPPASTLPVVKPRRLARRLGVAMLVGVIAIVSIASAVAWRFREVGDPYDVDRLPPMQWHPLFVREPVKLVWPKSDRPGHTNFDPGMQQFFITNHEMAYFKVGSTQKRNYKFQVTLSTNAWERVGIIFGYRTPAEDPTLAADEIARYQYVAFDLMGEKPSLMLERGRAKLQRATENARIVRHGNPLKIADVPERLGEKVLEVSVSESNGVRIFLDNVVVGELAELAPSDIIPKEDLRGVFGVFTHNNSCHFRDAKVYLFAPGK